MLTDYVAKDSTAFLNLVVENYSQEKSTTAFCGYACTDNSAWYKHGYKAAALIEGKQEVYCIFINNLGLFPI
jgi:3'-phosphoadenosine 5'-phosphosulfate (PAPS) 3'-phosphatase